MSECVWICTAPSNVDAEFGFGWPTSQYSLEERISLYDALTLDSEKGQPLPRERFPEYLETTRTATKGDAHKWKLPNKLPNYVKWKCPVISGDIAEILLKYDLGASNLYPIELRRADKNISYNQEFFVLNVGVAKASIVPDLSRGLKEYKKARTLFGFGYCF